MKHCSCMICLKRCSDPHEKLWLLNHYLDMFKGTLFRQTMFAEFEKITHERPQQVKH